MIDLDDIRGKLAAKYNFLFGKDDPSLAMVALLEAVLEQSVIDLNAQQEANLKALLKVVQQGTVETKASSNIIVHEGTEYACDQISTAITATMDEGREQIRADLRLAWNKIERARKITMFSAAVSSVCALIAVLAMLNVA